ncbi:FHA domain-containing protein [Desulfonatronovibrio magnus]|uniref:FHA domain-containing protein n=1 Tax=Desulfonatronovibrio magnus TaxID=698827 RepID=UPI0005EB87A5|nr:FHA domain-containing protein [Desulfonatronovibrio magnus]
MNSSPDSSKLKLIIHEDAQTSYEKEFSPDKEINVGRNELSDLILRSRRVSRNHSRIFFDKGQWIIEDRGSQNGTKLNGKKIECEKLKNGDNVQIGDYQIEIIWKQDQDEEETVVREDDRTVVLEDDQDLDKTVVTGPLITPQPADSRIVDRIIAPIKKNKIIAGVAAGVFSLFLIILIMPSSKNDEQDSEETVLSREQDRTETMLDLESQHRLSTYLQSGKTQFDAGNFSEALIRFQAVLELDPEHTEALELLTQTRQKIVEAEEARRLALEEERERMDRVRAISSRARQAMTANNLEHAREIIAEAVFLEPEDPNVIKLKDEIEKAIHEQQMTREEQEQQRAEQVALLRQHFEAGQRYYDQENFLAALQQWEKVIAMNIESPETAHIRHAIPQLRKLLEEDIAEDYKKAMQHYEKGDFTSTLDYLQKVVIVSPDYREAQRIMAEVSVQVESKARRLYQEGLVYEGLGQRSRAIEKWREVLEVMPFEDNDYYQRALGKLR